MADSDPPKLTLNNDKAASVQIWRKKFNTSCRLQRSWRDTSKSPMSPEHWVAEKAQCEIAAFYLTLSDDMLNIFNTTVLEKLSEQDKKQPWLYQQCLAEYFVGQDDVMPQRLAFFNCTQKPSESVTDFETRSRSTAWAKSWEVAHNTNITIMHSANSRVEEQAHHNYD